MKPVDEILSDDDRRDTSRWSDEYKRFKSEQETLFPTRRDLAKQTIHLWSRQRHGARKPGA